MGGCRASGSGEGFSAGWGGVDPGVEVQMGGGVFDVWYLDDGDILTHPALALRYLKAFDEHNKGVGAARNRKKTELVYYCTQEELDTAPASWCLDELKEEAVIMRADDGPLTLGVVTGSIGTIREQISRKAKVVAAMHAKAAVCGDTQVEHVLARQSLGIGRVNHILRVHGAELAGLEGCLEPFDRSAAAAQARSFLGVTEESFDQAALGVSAGGMGWRRAVDQAAGAQTAAMTAADPAIREMISGAARAGLLGEETALEAWMVWKQKVRGAYVADLEGEEKDLAAAHLEALDRWAAEGSIGRPPESPPGGALLDIGVPGGEGGDVGLGGGEGFAGGTRQHVQRQLARWKDITRLRSLRETLRAQGAWEQLQRLEELRDKGVSHSWLWHLDSRTGSVLSEEDYIINVQRRLGAVMVGEDTTCRRCGQHLDTRVEHSENCAHDQATRGHYACVNAVLGGLRCADCAACTEPRGLTTDGSRPADILTDAVAPGMLAAVDICVASINSSAAGTDAAAAAYKRKMRRYASQIEHLRKGGIQYRPMIWTAEGRPHPQTMRMLSLAADRAARKAQGGADPREYLRKWCHEIGIALARRRAAMVRATLPGPVGLAAFLSGNADRERPSEEFKLGQLEGCSSVCDPAQATQPELSRILEDAGMELVPA